jgi:serine phosphatase RsbU (regulator of sigma subunit)
VLFAIGDVAGHGIDAAVTMSYARQFMVSSALIATDPADILSRMNAQLIRMNAPMVTAIVGYVDAEKCEIIFANAGHPPPVFVQRHQAPHFLNYGDLPLGVMTDSNYTVQRIQASPESLLVLYTDGAVEHSRDIFEGEALLLKAAMDAAQNIEHDPAKAVHNAIFQNHSVSDDVAMLTIGFQAKKDDAAKRLLGLLTHGESQLHLLRTSGISS